MVLNTTGDVNVSINGYALALQYWWIVYFLHLLDNYERLDWNDRIRCPVDSSSIVRAPRKALDALQTKWCVLIRRTSTLKNHLNIIKHDRYVVEDSWSLRRWGHHCIWGNVCSQVKAVQVCGFALTTWSSNLISDRRFQFNHRMHLHMHLHIADLFFSYTNFDVSTSNQRSRRIQVYNE